MEKMVEGDKWELYIPSDLAYGDRGAPPDIGPGDVLVFTLHMLKLNGPGKPATDRQSPGSAGSASSSLFGERGGRGAGKRSGGRGGEKSAGKDVVELR